LDLYEPIQPELKTLDRLFAKRGSSPKDAALLWGLLAYYLEEPKEFERRLTDGLVGMGNTDWVAIGSELVDQAARDLEVQKVFPLWIAMAEAVGSTAFIDEVLAAEVHMTFEKIVTVAGKENDAEVSFNTNMTARAFTAFTSVLFIGEHLDLKAILFISAPVLASLDSDHRLDMTTSMDEFFPGKF
jgi:hypothetical protein